MVYLGALLRTADPPDPDGARQRYHKAANLGKRKMAGH
jgi:hypothetical protein